MASIDYPLEQSRRPGRKASLSEALYDWIATVDHKRLGLMYMVSALIFLAVAGIMALVMRAQLIVPNNDVVAPDTYNRLFTMHGTTMVFLVGMPIVAGMSNYLIPLMIGARDMAFPRLNAFGFWIFLFGGLLLYFSYLGGGGLSGTSVLTRCEHRLLDSGHPG
jgi:cytochrome c oxidase subunit 1